jgi:hypothetical protein
LESRAGGAEYPFMERERVKEVKGKEEGGEELLSPSGTVEGVFI